MCLTGPGGAEIEQKMHISEEGNSDLSEMANISRN